MRLGTIISIGASAVLGVGALLIARLWIPAHGPHMAAVQAATPAQDVPVVVAALPIPWGIKLESKYLKVAKLPPDDAPQGAYSSVGQILNQDGGPPIALTPMAAQEPVLPGKLSGPGERQTLAALVGPGMRAYTIAVTAVTAGGGHILPGDRVDVVLTRDLTAFGAAPPGPNGGGRRMMTSVVIQDVRVLGMDLNANPTSTQPAVASTATLEVNMPDAEKLALAAQAGNLSLALRRPGALEIDPVRPMQLGDLGPGGGSTGDAARPRRGRLVSAGSESIAPPGSSVLVVNGDAPATVSVPHEIVHTSTRM
jgi:pilus assembly protein CpaB